MIAVALACGGLFLASFLAATLLPAQSELTLAALLMREAAPVWLLLAVATAGNTAGSSVNWLLGRSLARFQGRRWFPASAAALARAERWYRRYGRWSLLLSWAPVVGDPLTLAAGVLREPFPSFVLMTLAAKLGRYLVVAAATLAWTGGP